MKSQLILFVFLGFVLLPMTKLHCQEMKLAIDLETCLQLGGASNLTIQEYQLRQELAKTESLSAKEWWLPEVYLGTQLHQLWGTAMNSDGRFFTDVNRQNFWGGLGFNVSWDFAEASYSKKAAALSIQVSEYQSQAERNTTLLEIIDTYYDFQVSQLHYEVFEQLVNQADTIAKQMEIQVDAGLRFESDMLLAKSNRNHLMVEMLNAKIQNKAHAATLTRLLNLDPKAALVSSDSSLTIINYLVPKQQLLDFNTVYDSRPELKLAELHISMLDYQRKSITKGLLLPELKVGSYGSYFGDVFSPLQPTSEINAALVWNIPLSSFIYRGDVKSIDSKISIQQNEISQQKALINEDVIRLQSEMDISSEQRNIAEEGTILAYEALQQSISRQQLGTVNPLEILQAQEIFIKTKLDLLRATAAFNKANYAYFVAVGNNL